LAAIPKNLVGQLVAVEWLDSGAPHGWQELGAYTSKAPMVCWSAGWVTYQEPNGGYLVIAGSLGKDGGEVACAHSPVTVPASAIQRVHRLAGLAVSKAPIPKR
jgi:hypothetical protein